MQRQELGLQVGEQVDSRTVRLRDGAVPVDVVRRDPTAVYAEKWAHADPDQGLYTERTGVVATDLLEGVIGRLSTRAMRRTRRRGKVAPLIVVEAAAGPGDHALHLAKRLPATHVVAVDSSEGSIHRIEQKKPAHEAEFGMGSQLTVVEGDALKFLEGLDDGSLDGFHANSFFHFLTPQERADYLATIARKLDIGSVAGASFKAYDSKDPLLTDPRTVIIEDNERGVLALPPDGIQRLFVKDPSGVEQEFLDAGLRVVDTFRWSVVGYDIPDKPSYFVGVLAEKAA